MNYLRTELNPLELNKEELSLLEVFRQELAESDEVFINVGYASYASLIELEHLIEETGIKNIRLILGMYYLEGIPQSLYQSALALNQRWKEKELGEIRLVLPFKSHEKFYLFKKDNKINSAIIGSPNLSFIDKEADNLNQYESGYLISNQNDLKAMEKVFDQFMEDTISANIAEISPEKLSFIKQPNIHLMQLDLVEQLTPPETSSYFQCTEKASFRIPLKVPAFSERFKDDGKHYTKSNINTGYAKPRSAKKSRNWFETQLNVAADIRRHPEYPKPDEPFFVITDDGYQFLAHTTSQNNKQFSAVGDELILGYWLKGRLEAAGLVKPVNDTQLDKQRTGMITKEMLEAYGADSLTLAKTDQKMKDSEGIKRDVWTLSFKPSK